MSFIISDLIVESIIRDGMESVRRDPTIIDDIFQDISRNLGPLMDAKYGDREINKIKEYFTEREVHVVQAFSQVESNLPAVSIQLIDNTESIPRAHLDDWEDDVQTPITDPKDLADLIVVSGIIITAYSPSSGTIHIDNSINLADVHVNHLIVDVDGTEFPITGGIDNTLGQKQVMIGADSAFNDAGPALIKSALNFTQHEQRGVIEDERLLLGIHTEERLLTIYLYTLIKYFLLARKKDLIERGFQLSTFSGSDFTRNLEYVEPVFSRYLTVSGIIQNSWTSDKVIPIDLVDVEVLVEKDKAGSDEFVDLTVKPNDND